MKVGWELGTGDATYIIDLLSSHPGMINRRSDMYNCIDACPKRGVSSV